jgi:hypothetical protein
LKGAPWLRYVTPPSIVPYSVMPFQVSGHFVTTKSSKLVHVAGCGGAVAEGAAFATAMSSADASVESTWAWPLPPAEFHKRVFPWRMKSSARRVSVVVRSEFAPRAGRESRRARA